MKKIAIVLFVLSLGVPVAAQNRDTLEREVRDGLFSTLHDCNNVTVCILLPYRIPMCKCIRRNCWKKHAS